MLEEKLILTRNVTKIHGCMMNFLKWILVFQKDLECLWALIVHLLAGMFLYSYETKFDQKLYIFTNKHKSLATSFNFTFRYIHVGDVLSINKGSFHDRVHYIPSWIGKSKRPTSTSDLELVLSVADGSL